VTDEKTANWKPLVFDSEEHLGLETEQLQTVSISPNAAYPLMECVSG